MLGPYLIGLSGTRLTERDRVNIQSDAVGGIILFTRNFENVFQITDYIDEIRSSGGLGKPIFVDHEGGRVQRFKEGFTWVPAMSSIGKVALQNLDQGLMLAKQAGFVLAAELRACGVDMTFAPVLDLDWGNSEIIGDRAFGKDPVLVSRLSNALIQGLHLAGMQGCGKHFPGHGWVSADSHLDLPFDNRSLEEILKVDVEPYRHNTSLSMAAVMPAHVVYEQVDERPACFSTKWLNDILRGQLRFDGAIISDDLDMAGAHGMGDIIQRAAKALDAGCDAVLACNNLDDIARLVDESIPQLHENKAERHRRLNRLNASGSELTWESLKANKDYQSAVDALQSLGRSGV